MPEPTEEQTREITDALLKGQKIHAIKIYRDATGEGLKEAKEFIEKLTAVLREKHPDKFPAAKAGCTSLVIASATLGGGIALVLNSLQ